MKTTITRAEDHYMEMRDDVDEAVRRHDESVAREEWWSRLLAVVLASGTLISLAAIALTVWGG